MRGELIYVIENAKRIAFEREWNSNRSLSREKEFHYKLSWASE
jgi:hypothetical protein